MSCCDKEECRCEHGECYCEPVQAPGFPCMDWQDDEGDEE